MLCVVNVAHRLLQYICVVNNDFITLHPLCLAHIFIYLCDHQYFQNLLLLLKYISFVFALVLVILGSFSCGSVRKKQLHVPKVSSEPCESEPIEPIEQEEVTTNNRIDNCCELLSEIPVIISNEKYPEVFVRELTCYCDGSYSHENQIGYSGFRASNGYSKYRSCPLYPSRSGSTESEIFAAYLALQYTAKYHYDTLTLYTDNSKVEQLFKRPKNKDYYNYSTFFQALQQCYEKNDHFHIRVERVCGHPTWYEQRQCSIKREFAKVDQLVRQKRQQHERRYYFKNNNIDSSSAFDSYRYERRYIKIIQAEKCSAAFITTSTRPASPTGAIFSNI